jgi:arabinogalactan endo-1,4-beta-galactosidase
MKSRYAFLLCFLVCVVFNQQTVKAAAAGFYLGVDLSYVNEVEDCGALYQVEGTPQDPYQIFHDYGANLVRIRLWNNPTWTDYSTFEDVVRSLERADAQGMDTLLDFHYSDTWADPGHQAIPAAWADITDVEELGQALYQYTYDTLAELDSMGLMPDLVQVGNEINTEILRAEDAPGYPIDWDRNALLLNQAIQAVRDVGSQSSEAPRIMLHVAKPEEVEGWLLAATRAGVTDYDIIGISYYPGWSNNSIQTTGGIINRLRYQFNKDVLIAETAYPWTLDGINESAGNILGGEFVLEDYPSTPDGQRQFLIDLSQTVFDNGGLGIVYWEPAWVSTSCRTLWGQGSHWENGTFFDFQNDNEVLPAMEFLDYAYNYPVDVTFHFQLDGDELPEQVYLWGDFTGMGRRALPLRLEDGQYTLRTRFLPDTEIRYQLYSSLPASAETMLLSGDCVDDEGYMSVTIPENSITINQSENGCPDLS